MGSAQGSTSSSSSDSWSLSEMFSNSQSTNNSLSSSSNQSSSTGHSQSKTLESDLSAEQLQILQNREKQYNEWFFPEMQQAVNSSDMNSPAAQAMMNQQSSAINQSFDASGRKIMQGLSQQGMLGDRSGVAASLNAQNERNKSSALSAAYAAQLGQMNTQKAGLLGTAAGLMTSPTNSAQFHNVSTSDNVSQSVGGSQSVSNAQSTSQSQSKSQSESTSKSKSKGWGASIG